nr:unnamed protein product [Digitaria exilis]
MEEFGVVVPQATCPEGVPLAPIDRVFRVDGRETSLDMLPEVMLFRGEVTAFLQAVEGVEALDEAGDGRSSSVLRPSPDIRDEGAVPWRGGPVFFIANGRLEK